MGNKKQNNFDKALKVLGIVVLVLAAIWFQSKIIFVLGDLQTSVLTDFDNAEKTAIEKNIENLPIPPIKIIEKHYIEKTDPVSTPYAGNYIGVSNSNKSSAPLPGSFAAGIN
ncbi:hypothetical protein ACFL3T_01780 [Patescibacteria group bacterium]